MIKDTVPCSIDLLQSAKFILTFPRITATQFFCQATNIPGLSVTNTIQNNPFRDMPVPGDKINYEDLIVEFLIDEELQSWLTIYYWINGYSFPKEFSEYKNLNTLSKNTNLRSPQYADAQLNILSTTNKNTVFFNFTDCFPVSLSGINLDLRVGAERTLTASATFKYKTMDVKF